MIIPTASDILRCIDHTLQDASDPDLPRMSVRSALATCRHLVRHVDLRLQHETAMLRDDIDKTAALLERVKAYLDHAAGVDLPGLRDRIGATLAAHAGVPTTGADGMATVRSRALALREQVHVVLAGLQRQSAPVKADEGYREIRRLIREYIAYELTQEARLVQPAFAGKGPRR